MVSLYQVNGMLALQAMEIFIPVQIVMIRRTEVKAGGWLNPLNDFFIGKLLPKLTWEETESAFKRI